LVKEGQPVALGSRALDLLIALVERAGDVVSRRELVKLVWPDVTVDEANLRVHIANLRRVLGDGKAGARYIINVPGRGYSFAASVERPAVSPPAEETAAPAQLRARTLPTPLQRMIGRDETVQALRAEVASHRFVTIVGPGGVGKTTVAIALAHAMTAAFADAICFVDLSLLRDAELVVSAVASAVGCVEETHDSLSRLLALLADKRLLLVVDSCEHVVESVAALTEG